MGFLDKISLITGLPPEDIFSGLQRREKLEMELPRGEVRSFPSGRSMINSIPSVSNARGVFNQQNIERTGGIRPGSTLASPLQFGGFIDSPSGGKLPPSETWANYKRNDELQRLKNEKEEDQIREEKFIDRKFEQDEEKNTLENRKLDVERELKYRQDALEKWKTLNPKGEVVIGENGNVWVVNPTTGQKTDTGIKSDKISEEQKHKWELEKIDRRGNTREFAPKPINPSQQRIAEDDATSELSRDERFKWLFDNKYLTFDKDNGLVINEPKAGKEFNYWGPRVIGGVKSKDLDNIKKSIQLFQSELKSKSNERMNQTLGGDKNNQLQENEVAVVLPDGRTIAVPSGEVDVVLKGNPGARRK